MRGIRPAVLALAVLVLASWPAEAATKDAINAAVERGVKFLKALQQNDGTWGYTDRDQIVGMTALAGLTLMECGVPTDDDSVQSAASAVRSAAVDTDQTYSIALSILFLDRLGEEVDVSLIESLTVRLLAGQGENEGWRYSCPKIGFGEQRRLSTLVKKRAELGRIKDPPKAATGKRVMSDLPPEIQKQLEQVQQQRARGGFQGQGSDNSNTQFAILGLWVARRHGLPVDKALAAAEKRFRFSVGADGGWGYGAMPGMGFAPVAVPLGNPNGSTPAMTCAGLLGVGLAYGAWNETALRTDPKAKPATRPGAPAHLAQDPSKDKIVVNAFHLLGRWVDAMNFPKGQAPRITHTSRKFYYFLWSLERVCVAYNVDKIGRTDWYDWGADILLANQEDSGAWMNGEFRGPPDTCFALLFLKRANLAKDLTTALSAQMKEGIGSATLKAGGGSGADLVRVKKPFFDGPMAENPKEKPAIDTDTQAARLSKSLVTAEGDKQEEILKELRDSKGSAYTQALVGVIPKLEGEARKKARAALADRLSRMTSETLGSKLEDDDVEMRRAAALAVAMKEDKTLIYKLIEMLGDDEVSVARAAHAALHSLTNEDFGPAKEATSGERTKAIQAWKAWWDKQQPEKKK